MNNIRLNGTQEFMGVNIPIIEGGFGDGKRVVTAKTISDVHESRLSDINASIKRLIENDRLKINIDYIDILSETVSLRDLAKELELFSSNRTKNAFILSERGYTKLIKAMDDDKSWEVMDEFVDEYFSMRQTIQEVINAEDLAILKICKANSTEEKALAINQYREAVVQPLLNTIETQKPLVGLAELRIDKMGCFSLTDVTKSLGLKRGQITKWAKEQGLIHKTIQEVNKAGEKLFKVYSKDGLHNSVGITEDGLREIKTVFCME